MNIHKVAALLFVLMAGTLAYAVSQLLIPLDFTVTTAATVTSTPASLSLGNILQGETRNENIVLTNSGTGTAFGLACSTSGVPTGISVTYTGCSGNLAPGASVIVTVTITVASTVPPGPYSGTKIIVEWT